MKKAVVIAFFAATAANAGTPVKSEYFYQTEAQKHQVTPELKYDSQKIDTGATTDVTGQTLSVRYEYGINEMLSTGVRAGYTMMESETGATSQDQTGMTDITLFLKGQNAFVDAQSLHWGVSLDYSPGDKEVNNDDNEVNGMSGGMTVNPFVGYLWMVGNGTAGVNFSTELGLGDRTTKTTTAGVETDTTTTGGNETALTGLYEHKMEKALIGTSLSYVNVNTAENETAGVESTTDGGNFYRLRVYPTYSVSEATTVLGELKYESLISENATYESWNNLTLQVGGRFTF